jgi:hypothetical protein
MPAIEELQLYFAPTQRVTAIKLRDKLVPKLPLGNPVSKALALRAEKLELLVLNSQAGAWELAHSRRTQRVPYRIPTQRVGTRAIYLKT